jgi:adenylate kinase
VQAFLAQYLLSQSSYPDASALCASILEHAGAGEPDVVVMAKEYSRPQTAVKQQQQQPKKPDGAKDGALSSSSSSSASSDKKTDAEDTKRDGKQDGKPDGKADGKKAEAKATDPNLKIVIAGAPCSGKGTQCEFLKEHFGVYHLSTGDLLRAEAEKGTKLGTEAKKYMDNGQLIPDDLIITVVKDKISEPAIKKKGWLLDGFPRTAKQAEALKEAGIDATLFLQLNVPDDILIKRVTGRRLDPATGKTYHVEFDPPPKEVEERCVQRADDTEEKIQTRLKAYHEQIGAISKQYADVKVEVDGNREKDAITNDIGKAVEEAQKKKGKK